MDAHNHHSFISQLQRYSVSSVSFIVLLDKQSHESILPHCIFKFLDPKRSSFVPQPDISTSINRATKEGGDDMSKRGSHAFAIENAEDDVERMRDEDRRVRMKSSRKIKLVERKNRPASSRMKRKQRERIMITRRVRERRGRGK